MILMFAALIEMSAQDTTILSFSMTNDIISGVDQRKDYNQQLCALVKVQVVDDITDVDGNVMGNIVVRGVEKWVYMAKGSRSMIIHLKNYLPVDVLFRNYEIKQLESNRVYKLVIKINNTENYSTSTVKGNYLRLRVYPKDASLVIWSDNMHKRLEIPNDDGEIKLYVPYGRYFFNASSDGYYDYDGSVFVDDGNELERILLKPVTGTLNVRSATDKTDIFINGVKLRKDKNAILWTKQLPPGKYFVEARRKGYVSRWETITVEAKKSVEISFATLFTEREVKRNEIILPTMESRRDSLLQARKVFLAKVRKAKEAAAKASALAKMNSYDTILLNDGSQIRCTVSDVRDNMVLIKQQGQKNVLRVNTKDIQYIEYDNGDRETF